MSIQVVGTEGGEFVLGSGVDCAIYIDVYDTCWGFGAPHLEHVSNLTLDEATRLLIALDILVTEAEASSRNMDHMVVKGDER